MDGFLCFTLLLIYCYSSSRICDASRRSCSEGFFYHSHFDKCLPCSSSPDRNEKSCIRQGCPGPPLAPSNLEVVQLKYAAVTVEWNSASGCNSDQEFYVQYRKCTEKWDVASEVPHEGIADPGLKKRVRYEVIGLESNVCYVFRVRSKSAIPGSHTSVFSNMASARTQGPPPAPSNLEVVQLTYAAVTVEWKSAFDGKSDQKFYVQYKKCAEKWDVASEVPHEGIADPGLKKRVRYEVMDLESDVCYEFRVCSRSALPGSHTIVFSTIVSERTQGPPPAPSNLEVVQLTEAAVTVEWISAFDGKSDQKFYVQYKKCAEKWDVASEVPHEGITDPGLKKTVRYEVMDLESDVCYEFRVRSRSALPGSHMNAFSNIVFERTQGLPTWAIEVISLISVVIVFIVVICVARRIHVCRRHGAGNGNNDDRFTWSSVKIRYRSIKKN